MPHSHTVQTARRLEASKMDATAEDPYPWKWLPILMFLWPCIMN